MFAAWLVTSAAFNESGLMINPYLAVAGMFIVGIAIGWFNGPHIVYLGLNAFIATLAMHTYGAIILLSLILTRLTSGNPTRAIDPAPVNVPLVFARDAAHSREGRTCETILPHFLETIRAPLRVSRA